ncbi:MAG: nucleotidyltransferase family protein [Nitrosomonas sp.]|nr:nucleotidyltransferase family protein [Nitrosomonas sp.]MDP1950667.1 nucleotidyltransferase family protein [Nitrosomonas sp.]
MKKAGSFVAVVLAADRTTRDPITQHTGAACKALAPVCGTPMILRVLNALEASDQVKSIILCGPPESVLADCPELQQRIDAGRVTWLPNLDSPSRSALKGFEQIEDSTPILLTTADHALLTPAIVQHFLQESQTDECDATVGLVKYEDIIAAFPKAKRTVTKLRDGGFCGCNLFTFNHCGRDLVSLWRQAEDLRKRPWRLIAQILGPWTVIRYLFGLLTLEQALQAVSVKTGIRVKGVMLPYPQAGIDVDKVEDLRLAESVLTESIPPDQP